jgi:hypothetical protein
MIPQDLDYTLCAFNPTLIKVIGKTYDLKWKKIQDKLDMSKRFPGYFSKWIFRSAVAICLIIAVGFVMKYGIHGQLYLHCDSEYIPCENPLWQCLYGNVIQQPLECDKITRFCDKYPCEQQYLQPGESYGQDPDIMMSAFRYLVIAVMILAFAVNHVWYRLRGN